MVDYSGYQDLLIEKSDGVALLTMNRPEVFNATGFALHNELSRVWLDLGQDPEVRVAVITGAGNAFSAGGDFEMIERSIGNAEVIAGTMQEARDIVHNMINLDKPVISAINGVAVGAGLAVALLADISIASERARFTDGHVRLGVAAGDHAAVIWPLLMGMAKAKYYLLTCEFLDGAEAERLGLVSLCVPHDELMERSMAVARKLAAGPPARHPLHQAVAEPVAAHGRTHRLRLLPGPRNAKLHGPRRARGPGLRAPEARPGVSFRSLSVNKSEISR